jgi:hypothetical protein
MFFVLSRENKQFDIDIDIDIDMLFFFMEKGK